MAAETALLYMDIWQTAVVKSPHEPHSVRNIVCNCFSVEKNDFKCYCLVKCWQKKRFSCLSFPRSKQLLSLHFSTHHIFVTLLFVHTNSENKSMKDVNNNTAFNYVTRLLIFLQIIAGCLYMLQLSASPWTICLRNTLWTKFQTFWRGNQWNFHNFLPQLIIYNLYITADL